MRKVFLPPNSPSFQKERRLFKRSTFYRVYYREENSHRVAEQGIQSGQQKSADNTAINMRMAESTKFSPRSDRSKAFANNAWPVI